MRPYRGICYASAAQSGGDLLLLAHLRASDGDRVGRQVDDLLLPFLRGFCCMWLGCRAGSRGLGIAFLRGASRFAIEIEPEQNYSERGTAPCRREQGQSGDVDRTQGCSKGNHDPIWAERIAGRLASISALIENCSDVWD